MRKRWPAKDLPPDFSLQKLLFDPGNGHSSHEEWPFFIGKT